MFIPGGDQLRIFDGQRTIGLVPVLCPEYRKLPQTTVFSALRSFCQE